MDEHRSGDPVVLTGYMGRSTAFEDALADFGAVYAGQNERDHACLRDVVRSGRIQASQLEKQIRRHKTSYQTMAIWATQNSCP